MKSLLSLAGLVFVAATVSAVDTPATSPKKTPAIQFPVIPDPTPKPPPPPPPPREPAGPAKLGKDQFYVVASTRPLLVLASGTGEVSITKRTPPFMLPAAVAVGWTPDAKDPEFVSWGVESKYLYVIKAVKSGSADLLIFPATTELDATTKEQIPLTEKDAVRKSLLLDDGKTPEPAPKPVDPPTPVIPSPAKGFRVLFLYEKEGNLSREQLNIANSSKIAAYLNEKCAKGPTNRPEWRKWDVTTVDRAGALDKESPALRQLWTDAKPKLGRLPQVVIATDQSAVTFEWEPTEDAQLAVLRKYGG